MSVNSETSTPAGKQLSDGNTTGLIIGQSATDKIGFYGETPAVQDAFDYSAVATTNIVSTTTTTWGFTTSTAALGLINLVNDIRAKLVALGLIATS